MALSIVQAVTRAIESGDDSKWAAIYWTENEPDDIGFYNDALYLTAFGRLTGDALVMNACVNFGTRYGMEFCNVI